MLQITPIPAFADNYIWLLTDGSGGAAVVDPGDAAPVRARLAADGLRLTSILITHHHGDHIGGVAELKAAYPGLRVYGPRDPRIREVTQMVGEGDSLALEAPAVSLRVLAVPGHTASHIAYLGEGALFCGDTLFAGGCGRVFDGTFAQLAASLERIAALPGETLCYCAHEYTLDNLGFAKWVEPDSRALQERLLDTQHRRARGEPTVPSPLALELATNPFLRTREPAVIAAAAAAAGHSLSDSGAVFTALRRWKDTAYD